MIGLADAKAPRGTFADTAAREKGGSRYVEIVSVMHVDQLRSDGCCWSLPMTAPPMMYTNARARPDFPRTRCAQNLLAPRTCAVPIWLRRSGQGHGGYERRQYRCYRLCRSRSPGSQVARYPHRPRSYCLNAVPPVAARFSVQHPVCLAGLCHIQVNRGV